MSTAHWVWDMGPAQQVKEVGSLFYVWIWNAIAEICFMYKFGTQCHEVYPLQVLCKAWNIIIEIYWISDAVLSRRTEAMKHRKEICKEPKMAEWLLEHGKNKIKQVSESLIPWPQVEWGWNWTLKKSHTLLVSLSYISFFPFSFPVFLWDHLLNKFLPHDSSSQGLLEENMT